MRQQQSRFVFISILILASFLLAACNVAQASEEEIEAKWESSAHADAEARAFSRWNDDDPPEISPNCAKCHSTYGYHDFLGLDGTTPGQVDNPAPVGSTVECEACHNEVSFSRDSAVMPSGIELTGLNQASDCMECHQGRASSVQVDEATAGLTADELNEELSLPNIHNNPVGPLQYGTEAKGGFEYSGMSYLGKYEHTPGFETCYACHDAHTLTVEVQKCSACHLGANTQEDLPNIRTSNIDYDGDGDITEGMAGEVETMQERLLIAMKLYAAKTEGAAAIEYDGGFIDEAGEKYTTWTPRLLRAAFNYQYTEMDVGSYAHNGQYAIQLLYDSLTDLGANIGGMTRPE